MAEYDKDDSGTVDANEFSMIMVTIPLGPSLNLSICCKVKRNPDTSSCRQVHNFCTTEIPRGDLVLKSTGKAYEIPSKGSLKVAMSYESDLPSIFDTGRDEGVDSIIDALRRAKTGTVNSVHLNCLSIG